MDERPVIVNIGSVGQPRDRDPRSSYVIFDGNEVVWRRVEYDIEATRKLIKANPNLEDRLVTACSKAAESATARLKLALGDSLARSGRVLPVLAPAMRVHYNCQWSV